MNLASHLKAALPAQGYALLRLIADEATRRGLILYAAGGLPRDLLLQRLTRDLDLVLESDALPFARALARAHGGRVTAHPAFHTATWFLPPQSASDASPLNLSPNSYLLSSETPSFIDFISARSETYAHPAALPSVQPGRLADDLRRRDFTVNALALRLDGDHFGELIDRFGGLADLRQGRVRVLHSRSFIDDPTRIFRALRYAGRYGFKLARDTASLVPGALEYVDKLSPERLRHELDLILEEDEAASILPRLADFGLLASVQPSLPIFDLQRSTLLHNLPPAEFDLRVDRASLGYHLWLMDSDDATLASLSSRLDFTAGLAKSLRAASRLKQDLPALAGSKPSQWTERLDKVPPLAVYAVQLVTRRHALAEYLAKWRRFKPTITGEDLKARGLVPGPEFKRILSRLRAAWVDGEVKTTNEESRLLESLL